MRDVDLPYGAGHAALITLDNGHGPHPAEHVRPGRAGEPGRGARRRSRAPTRRGGRGRCSPASRSSSRSAPTCPASRASATGRRRSRSRASGTGVFRRFGELARPVVRVRQRRRDGRRPRDRAALHATGRCPPARPRVSLPECFLGLVPGWGGSQLLPRAGRRRPRRHRHHREPAEPEPAAKPAAGRVELGIADVAVRAGRLPRGVDRLGGPGAHRRGDGATARRRPVERGLGRRGRARPGASPTPRPTAPRPRRTARSTCSRSRAPRTATRGSPPRTRRWPT